MKKNVLEYKSNCCTPHPSVVVTQSIEGIKGLSNCFVRVTSINTTFYVSTCHELTVISQSPVFVENYDATANPLALRSQTCYDYAVGKAYIYDPQGRLRTLSLEES